MDFTFNQPHSWYAQDWTVMRGSFAPAHNPATALDWNIKKPETNSERLVTLLYV